MAKEKNLLDLLKSEINKFKNKSFNVYFFVIDSKGTPSGELTYIYQNALTLKEMGYNVTMLHHEKDFVGVEDWLGEKYANLPHKNIEKENVDISPADFLFIPEIYANVMSQTKKLPCKKVAILHNQNYLTSTIPVGVTWEDMNIFDVITTTKVNENTIVDYFPKITSWVVSPSISDMFRHSTEPQQLIINVVSKSQSDIDKIIKPFYWKYPVYKWVSFRDLRGLPQSYLAEALSKGAITIWMDDETNFGYTLLQAMKSGSIVLAKVPDEITDWMVDANGELVDGPIWFSNIKSLPKIISSLVRTWTLDDMPQEFYDTMSKFDNLYSEDRQRKEIEDVYVNGIFKNHENEMVKAYEIFKNNKNEKETK